MFDSIPFVFIFILILAVNLFLFIKLSGWDKLAQKYGYHSKFQGKTVRMTTAYIGMVRYRNCVSIGVNAQGLYVSPFELFRLGYPPIFVRWEEISRFEKKQGILGLGQYYALDVGNPRIRTIKLSPRIFRDFPEIVDRLANGHNF
ncbi:hypothetical protein Lepto7376_1307 [[Leptolyngbya] sp. PCC 7376]|uniref:hypothetical protein n=1 Tax=[Leptolyngbya] sp. PCC 7376 TaxID=111781 RepID=UPI00029EFAC5|nr:hypothetical protein [[Leptolyngbya] sp. PCC 7376]AFY37659.1 hypothetical protein Lepto7376_1307 [[Leptolyngbya] sp. PCC 7376]